MVGSPGQHLLEGFMTSFMTSSLVKVLFSLNRKVPVCFFPVVENVLSQIHIQLAARGEFFI